jgi:uncharacterized membrane protein YtjA (UPF0391 family)
VIDDPSRLIALNHIEKSSERKEFKMDLLQWALIAFVVAIIAGLFGFTGVAQGAASIGRVLFGLFLVIAVIFLVLALLGVSILT